MTYIRQKCKVCDGKGTIETVEPITQDTKKAPCPSCKGSGHVVTTVKIWDTKFWDWRKNR